MGFEEPVLAIVFTSAFLFVVLSVTYVSLSMIVSASSVPFVGVVVNGSATKFSVTLIEMRGAPTRVVKLVFATESGPVTCSYNGTWACTGPLTVTGGAELLPGAADTLAVEAAPGLFIPGRVYTVSIIGDGWSGVGYFRPT